MNFGKDLLFETVIVRETITQIKGNRKSSIHWFTSQMVAMTRAGQFQCQELLPGLSFGCTLDSFSCSPRHISRELDQNWSSCGFNRCLHGIRAPKVVLYPLCYIAGPIIASVCSHRSKFLEVFLIG